uniref:Uncharacterized protein n=1 Tax=Rotaria sordida TaxID=392033 RepID=A0A813SAD8_9BILA|nr:unnamed protein product [Rotaria sordida]CAF3676927.1 unnamed protein product [Rotaria sordida]
MNIKRKSLEYLKKKIGYLQDDDTYVVKPGIRGDVDYLIDLLKLKCVEDAKCAKSSKNIQSSSSLNRTTVASSTGTKLVSAIPLSDLSETSTIKHSNLSNNQHKKNIVDSINFWWENNKSNIDSSQFCSLKVNIFLFLS